MADTGVDRAIGAAVAGAGLDGAMDMEAGPMAAATPEAMRAAEVSTVEAADSMVVEPFMVEAGSMAEVVSTEVVTMVAVATVGDTANRG